MHSTRLQLTLAFAASALLIAVPHAGASSCTLAVLDTVAGLGSEAAVAGCEPAMRTTLSVTGPAGARYTQSIVLDAFGNATTLIPSNATTTAGTYEVTAAGQTASFTVTADRIDDAHSVLSVSPKTIRANGRDIATITAVLLDRFDNPVAGRPIALLSDRTSDDISASSTQTDDEGRFLWTVKTPEAGTITLIPYDIIGNRQMKLRASVQAGNPLSASLTGRETGGDPVADISPVIVDRFSLSLPQGATDVKANELFSLTIRAMYGQDLVRAYVGTLIVESSDPEADLPKKGDDAQTPDKGRVDIRSVDQGSRNVPLSFVLRQGGKQTITVSDKLDPTIRGEILLNVVSGDGKDGRISIVSPQDRTKVKGSTVMLQGKAPSLINLRVKGGAEVVDTESDAEGVFRVNVPLNPADREITLFVASENGTYESEPVHIIIDNDQPTIQTITITPQEGKAGDPASIVVITDADATRVAVTLQGKETTLSGTGTTFTGTITAPAREGVFDVTVIATDHVGNAITMLTKWTVKPKLMAIVEGLQAEANMREIVLNWKAIDRIPVREYKIYIADEADPTNVLYSIATGSPVASAVVSDLPPGKTYRFTVTAISTAGEESPEPSRPAVATPLGTVMTVSPGEASLLMEWTAMPALPLSQYLLEFGTEPGVFTERRTVNGQATSYILRDLLDNVTYYLRLTPVTVTGKTETTLSALASGTPSGTGTFVAGPSEPVPSDLIPDPLHGGAPLQPVITPGSEELANIPGTAKSGIPTIVISALLVSIAAVMGFQWHYRRKAHLLAQEFLRMMEVRYHS
ncbi:MAG: fibronectin type III domain-containing protein [Candidatus Peribacteraceae bacterium]|nr:fibronectin type III domain-containing protein [Candidatus Peribacteraceae bacterium]